MFVRKKPNRSGSVSVVVVEKRNGKVCYLKTMGISSDSSEIDRLYSQGKQWIMTQTGQRDMFYEQLRNGEEKSVVENLLNKIEHILINGTQLILNPVYQSIGFDKIDDDVLKHLVVSRICQPQSKVATVDYLKSYFDEDVDLNKIYRYLDKLSNNQLLIKYPNIPWKNVKGIRDILSHHYFDLDAEVIFNICKKDANELLETTIKIIEELN